MVSRALRLLVMPMALLVTAVGARPPAVLADASTAIGAAAAIPHQLPAVSYQIATGRRGQFLVLWAGPSQTSRALFMLWPRNVWGAPTTLSVLAVRGGWIKGLVGSALAGGPAGLDNVPVWVSRDEVVLSWTRYAIDISLSAHRLRLVRAGRVVGSWAVGVGAPSSPTPTGRFELADKLPGAELGPGYGCCILGLSAMQARGAIAGGQVAIHGTQDTASIGANLSNGCVHGTDAMLRELGRRLPLGAPVFIDR